MTEAAAALEHARLQELLAAFVDDELSANDSGPVEKHLRTCARCQREVALHRTLSRALSQEPVPAGSFRLRRRIEQMGQRGRERVERFHSYAAMGETNARLYETLRARKAGDPRRTSE